MKKSEEPQLTHVRIGNEVYFRISDVDRMRPFFMSIVSASDHWMFIGSNGGISAGRKNTGNALFPYRTDDKIIESSEHTGSKTIIRIEQGGRSLVWEPFSVHYASHYALRVNLYKNVYGNKVIFEEVNEDLALAYRFGWSTSEQFGFVKTARIVNLGKDPVTVSLLDGIQNILPHGVSAALQTTRSNLVDAYKRSELDRESGLGVYTLSAIIVDKAEPSEALKASIVLSTGIERKAVLLSTRQLPSFRRGLPIREEKEVKAEQGAYFVQSEVTLEPEHHKEWMIVADVNKSITQVIAKRDRLLYDNQLPATVLRDIEDGTRELLSLSAAADGLQRTSDLLRDTRHFANTMFNIMRGGIFDNHYQVEKADVLGYIRQANTSVSERFADTLAKFPPVFGWEELKQVARQTGDPDLIRLSIEYLPLKFSRRHGDPSRPWNQFNINLRNERDGSKVLDYEGNWRDIFQNWEALVHAYPLFIEGMIFKFLNASTFDGYNPYRITKSGIDWEKIEADDPWSYIGYWGDHQIIYLSKFLEFALQYRPGMLEGYLDDALFVYANVPYKIKPYREILQHPKDTIDFDHELDKAITRKRASVGADSALLTDRSGAIYHVSFLEKILATTLAKVANFIPEGGIWMNTQRPEWNDANNALVGNGVSMVTLYYLRRFLSVIHRLLESSRVQEAALSEELVLCFTAMHTALTKHESLLQSSFDDQHRRTILDALGQAAGQYRDTIYNRSFSGKKESLPCTTLASFVATVIRYLDHSIRANQRSDSLYHAYNLMTVSPDGGISISYLPEMLEGQVAALSSGYLTALQALQVLDGLRKSKLYREDQNSYLLYPDKDLPGFFKKNCIPTELVEQSAFLRGLVQRKNTDIIEQDVKGGYHFNGDFRNAADLSVALRDLPEPPRAADKEEALRIYEKVFNHKAFTGRSGTFFGYEGLGSIYWHMVSKLLLAVQECCLNAIEEKEDGHRVDRLIGHYYEINEGIGVHKSPALYGAFPTDPYSHTPANKGAQQPGMTGQVKEDLLCRYRELGLVVKQGALHFDPRMLRKAEFLSHNEVFTYVDLRGKSVGLPLEEASLCFTYCQVPVVYKMAQGNHLEVMLTDGTVIRGEQPALDLPMSKKVFGRTGEISAIKVYINSTILR